MIKLLVAVVLAGLAVQRLLALPLLLLLLWPRFLFGMLLLQRQLLALVVLQRQLLALVVLAGLVVGTAWRWWGHWWCWWGWWGLLQLDLRYVGHVQLVLAAVSPPEVWWAPPHID